MRIESLNIQHLRILEEASLQSDASFVYLYGENGSGKTSVLEAIHLLAVGQSFRNTQQRNLIQYEKPLLRVRATFRIQQSEDIHKLGIEKSRDGSTQIRHNQKTVKRLAEVASLLPLRSVTPDSHAIVSGGPVLRRRYMDWGVFHVEQGTAFPWREYNRLLAQRNSLLKANSDSAQLRAIDNVFAMLGEQIASARENYVQRLNALLPEILNSLDTNINLKISHSQGWSRDESFENALMSRLEQCKRFKATSVGPHRADLQLLASGKPAREILSRGQQKLVLYALTLAQVTDFYRNRNSHMLMLCDDLQSELDAQRTKKLTNLLLDQGHQLFVTGTAKLDSSFDCTQALFHVKHGVVQQEL